MRIDAAAWLPIPGFPPYEINAFGRIRKPTAKGYKEIAVRAFRSHHIVALTRNGKARTFRLRSLLGRTFLRPLRQGEVYTYRNGDTLDDIASNICITTQRELGRRIGRRGTRRRAVEKIDENGEVIGAYRSARQAAKENYMSLLCVTDRCHGKVKAPPFFRWAK
ncbi:MAG: hypothetical protein IJ849_09525 [Selenomonadaceae bacterium]|nr:hypothetical protein [Selenomonadaceae bacterium]